MPDLDELDIRRWFVSVDLEQARDTLNVCRGIVETRMEAQPKRKPRSDKGQSRDKDAGSQGLLDG
jgi:hypothetical protein